ncbi:MAG: thiamine diphosphokinase [Anaerolineales bacterium]
MRVVIFSNGRVEHPELDRDHLRPDDSLYAADGGLHHILAFDLLPDLVIGDLDSIDGGLVRRLKSRSIEILQFPPRKDETDLELALREAVLRGADEILILGALGGRWDQTFANMLLPTLPEFQKTDITYIDGLQEIHWIRPGREVRLQGAPGETVSLIPLIGDVDGVRTSGLEYPLEGETLRFGATRGVSNLLTHPAASIEIKRGILLCVHERRSRLAR